MRKLVFGFGLLVSTASMSWATLVIDDFTTLDSGIGSVVAPPTCGSPQVANNTGTNTMGGRHIEVTSSGNGCATLSTATPSSVARLSLDDSPQDASGTITWSPSNAISFSNSLLQNSTLNFLYRVDTGFVGATPNQSSVVFEFCLDNGTCMSRRMDFLGQIFPAQMFSWSFGSFLNYSGFWSDLTSGHLVSFVQLTLIGQNGQDLIIDNIIVSAPEPSTFFLLGSALVGAAFLRRRRRA